MKQLFLIPALALALSPLQGTTTFSATSRVALVVAPANGGVFAVAQAANANPDPAPAPMGSLNITGAGLLDFVFQQLYAGLSAEEADRVRAVLAPQYAALAQFLQGSFNGADQVNLPPEVFADPLPPTDPGSSTSAVSVTQAMAVAAATTLLNEPGAPAWLQGAATAPAPALLLDPASASWLPVAVSTSALFSEGAATSLLSVSVSATQPLAFGTGVPEPSTLLLAAAGLVLALGRTRHARR